MITLILNFISGLLMFVVGIVIDSVPVIVGGCIILIMVSCTQVIVEAIEKIN